MENLIFCRPLDCFALSIHYWIWQIYKNRSIETFRKIKIYKLYIHFHISLAGKRQLVHFHLVIHSYLHLNLLNGVRVNTYKYIYPNIIYSLVSKYTDHSPYLLIEPAILEALATFVEKQVGFQVI